jgi:hypothetical protein
MKYVGLGDLSMTNKTKQNKLLYFIDRCEKGHTNTTLVYTIVNQNAGSPGLYSIIIEILKIPFQQMKCSQNTPGFTKTKFFKKNIF